MRLRYRCPYLLYCSLAAIILSSSVGDAVYAQDRGSQVEVIKPTKSDISPPLRAMKPHKPRKTIVPEKTVHLNPNRTKHRQSMTRQSAQ